jgi:hypothetical protein
MPPNNTVGLLAGNWPFTPAQIEAYNNTAPPGFYFDPTTGNYKESPYPTDKANLETMDISKTKLSTIFKNYPPLPTAPITVKPVYDELVELAKVKVPAAILKAPKMIRNGDTWIGIEIEVEKYLTTPQYPNYTPMCTKLAQVWSAKGDSSLRDGGHEFVSKVGIRGQDAGMALAMLNACLYGTGADTNYRCGTHVHVNVRDFTVEQFVNMVMLYILFEATFYQMSGNRWKNIFCVPLRASSSEVERIFKIVKKSKPTYDDFRRVFTHFKKYMAFNLLPTGKGLDHHPPFGTIEFRHHRGESDGKVLVPWIQMILDIHRVAQEYSFPDLKEKVFNLNTDSKYIMFAESVFEGIPGQLPNEEIITDMYEGSAFMKELYVMAEGA